MNGEHAAFVRGFAAAAATLAREHNMPSLAADLLRLNGLDLDDLRRAGVEEFDLAPLRNEMGRRAPVRSPGGET